MLQGPSLADKMGGQWISGPKELMANGGQGDEGSEEYVEWDCGEWVVQKVRPVGSNLRVIREVGIAGK